MAGGRPKGSTKPRIMAEALTLALNREADNAEGKPTKKMYLIADKLVDLAVDGDMQAIKEINDRIDGKPTQTLAGDPEAPLFARDLTDEQRDERIAELLGKTGVTDFTGGKEKVGDGEQLH